MAPRKGHVFKSLSERLEEKYTPEPNSGCWLWLGGDNGVGYGKILGDDGKMDYAHRASYKLHKGPIPDGLHLDHLCRVTFCINPDHLEPVTNQENARRGNTGHHNSAKIYCIHGHPLDGNVYFTPKGYRSCKTCHQRRQRAYEEKKRHVQRRSS